jgi:hypothetical protein
MTSLRTLGVSAILCADWAKDCPKRAVYVVDVEARGVRRLAAAAWTVNDVLAHAERRTSRGTVLTTFDAPLGVPESYLVLLCQIRSGSLRRS